jgi:YVTN family beta-propeller protein
VASLAVAALVFTAAVVVELAALALVPATANAAPSPVTAYVTNRVSNTVTPIDLSTNTPGSPISVGSSSFGVAVTADDTTAYVINATSNSVTPIAVATNTPGTPIHCFKPHGVAVTPDGTTAYVTNRFDATVTPIAVGAGWRRW